MMNTVDRSNGLRVTGRKASLIALLRLCTGTNHPTAYQIDHFLKVQVFIERGVIPENHPVIYQARQN